MIIVRTNREGAAFDVGEMFSEIRYETRVQAAEKFAALVDQLPFDVTPAQAALAWVVQQPGGIPGAPLSIR